MGAAQSYVRRFHSADNATLIRPVSALRGFDMGQLMGDSFNFFMFQRKLASIAMLLNIEIREKMKLQKYLTVCILFGLIAISGCQSYSKLVIDQEKSQVENPSFTAEITLQEEMSSFELRVINKSNSNIELDWNKTLYVVDGQTAGGFILEGTFYTDKNNAYKLPDVIFPNSELKKIIYPSNLAIVNKDGWDHGTMNEGSQGIFLTLLVDGKPITERLATKISLFKGRTKFGKFMDSTKADK